MKVRVPRCSSLEREVAIETLDALEAGLEEVFPGEPSKKAAEFFKADPAALQATLAQRVRPVA